MKDDDLRKILRALVKAAVGQQDVTALKEAAELIEGDDDGPTGPRKKSG